MTGFLREEDATYRYGYRQHKPQHQEGDMGMIKIHGRIAMTAVIAVGLILALPAAAQKLGSPLAQKESGSISDQLDMDITPIPIGMGALFVPSLTDAGREPAVLVYYGDERVAWGRTGERIVVPPGEYKVVVGHGELEDRPQTTVRVVDQVTTPVKPFFGAIRISAVNGDYKPVEIDYVIEDGDGRSLGAGGTADSSKYKNTKTWLLPAKTLVIGLENGDEATRNAISVSLAPGQVLRYRLIMDGNRLVQAQLAERELAHEAKWWRLRWVIGGDASYTQLDGQLGSYNGEYIRAGLFTRASLGIDHGANLALANIDIDESWISITDRPDGERTLQKFTDEVSLELLYNVRLAGIIGPYIRGQARTSLFLTKYTPVQNTVMTIEEIDGGTSSKGIVGGKDVQLFEAFKPLDARAAGGIGISFVDNQWVTASLRVGAAYRAARYNKGLFLKDFEDTTITAIELADDNSLGAEGGAKLELRLGQNLSVGSELDFFMPLDQLTGDEDQNPVFRLDTSATISINQFLALTYNFYVRQDAYEIDENQISQFVSLRLTHTLF